MTKGKILILYHSETSGASKSILTLKSHAFIFHLIKIPMDFNKAIKPFIKNLHSIFKSKIIIVNSLGVLKNLLFLGLFPFLKLMRKKIFIYWHESRWIWKGHVSEKVTIGSIILNKTISYVVKNSINMAVSKYCIKWLNSKFQTKNEIELLYNTIDLKKTLKLSKFKGPDYSEKKFKVIMALAAATKRKGFHIFIDIAEKTPSNYKFIWVGKSGDLDKIFVERIELINEKSDYEKIQVFDYNPNPYPILKNSDIFFLPSLDEPFGLVYLEAFILGKFVIAPKTTGFSEIIEKNSKLAFIYSNIKEVIELLNSKDINSYIRHFKEERLQLAKQFDNDRFNKKIVEILKKYIN